MKAPAMLAVRAGEGRTVALLAGLFASVAVAIYYLIAQQRLATRIERNGKG